MKKMLYALLFILVALPSQASAQEESDTLSFSLSEAIDYAMQHAYQKINADHDVEVARKKVWETTAIGLPQVSASTAYNYHIQQAVTPLPAEFAGMVPPSELPADYQEGDPLFVSFGTKQDANVGLTVNQLIFDGSYIIGLKASKVYLKISEEALEKTMVEIKKMVFQAYYMALMASKNIDTFNRSLAINQQILKETEAYYENGFREHLDVSQIKLMESNAKNRLLEAHRSYKVAMATLKYVMGMSLSTGISLTDDVARLVNTAYAFTNGTNEFALESNIDFRMATTNTQSMKLLWQNKKMDYLPKLYGTYSYSGSGFSGEWSPYSELTPSQFVGVSLKIPLFTSGMRMSTVKQSKIEYLKSQNDLSMISEQLKREFLTASTNLSSAKDQFDNASENKKLAYDIYQMTLTKFNNGLANSSILAQNESQYIQAEIAYIQSSLNMLNAHTEYQKITGKL